jgi:chorismate mutase
VGKTDPTYYLVDSQVLPSVFTKVIKAKRLLETGEAKTVAEAVDSADLSRSAFYKYKDSVRLFHDMKQGNIVTLSLVVHDRPGVLAELLSMLTSADVNILTINQSIPTDGAAPITISVVSSGSGTNLSKLLENLRRMPTVISVEVLAG